MVSLPNENLPNLNVTPVQPPDVLGTVGNMLNLQRAATLNQMTGIQAVQQQQEFNDSQAIRQSLVNNTHADPATGSPTIDSGGMLKDLMQNPSALMKFNQMQAEMQIKQQEAMKDHLANVQTQNSIAGSVAGATLYAAQNGDPQAALDRGHQAAIDAGLPAGNFPTTWSPDLVPKLQQLKEQGMNSHDQVDTAMGSQRLYQENAQNLRTGAAALANEYKADPQTDEFSNLNLAAQQVQTAYANYSKALQQGKDTGAAVFTMATGVARSENKNVSPRVANIDQLQQAKSWSDELQSWLDKASSGGDISPSQVKSLADLMSNRLEDSRAKQAITDAKFQGMAIGRGIPAASAGVDPDHALSNPKISFNPFFANKDVVSTGTPGEPKINNEAPAQPVALAGAEGEAPAQPAAPAAPAAGATKWISKAKYDALPKAAQDAIAKDGVQVK